MLAIVALTREQQARTGDVPDLPADLPPPVDDGAADHLTGMPLPGIALPATDGRNVSLHDWGAHERTVVYAYPRTGAPGEPLLTNDWDLIPGARGCSQEACSFRDHHQEVARAGADVVGLSTQDIAGQRKAVDRLHLPFLLVSDADLRLTRALRLPTFTAGGRVLLKRMSMIVRDGGIEHVFIRSFRPMRRPTRSSAG